MKIKLILSVLLFGLGLAASGQNPKELPAPDQPQAGKLEKKQEISPQQERFRQRVGTQIFNIMDTNHDGVIDIDEFRAYAPKFLFGRADTNGDGKIDKEEWMKAPGGGGLMQGLRRYREFFAADRDLDGRLSHSEYDGSDFDRLDLNHDGYLSLAEWKRREWEQTNLKIEEALCKYDRNHDGKVTRSEFGGSAEEFDSMDVDMDAEITRADIRR
ncbi:MAG TPA: hypothetical protein VGQ81_16400 [Acidobacteriota bacterium]|jgi:Ca2+-binding EF-hand superfamily protein|nr:hypothetical protein [Acidobacteriota bacterium]